MFNLLEKMPSHELSWSKDEGKTMQVIIYCSCLLSVARVMGWEH